MCSHCSIGLMRMTPMRIIATMMIVLARMLCLSISPCKVVIIDVGRVLLVRSVRKEMIGRVREIQHSPEEVIFSTVVKEPRHVRKNFQQT